MEGPAMEIDQSTEPERKFPEEFSCPISHALMKDPVILASGETYDRSSLEDWLEQGHRTYPMSNQILQNTVLISNNLVKKLIDKWKIESESDIAAKTLQLKKNCKMVIGAVKEKENSLFYFKELWNTLVSFNQYFFIYPVREAANPLHLDDHQMEIVKNASEKLLEKISNGTISKMVIEEAILIFDSLR